MPAPNSTPVADKDDWQEANRLLEQRALFLQDLSFIIPTLTTEQAAQVGQQYEDMLASDSHYLGLAQTELSQTRDSLRGIKKGEKALPAYQANMYNR